MLDSPTVRFFRMCRLPAVEHHDCHAQLDLAAGRQSRYPLDLMHCLCSSRYGTAGAGLNGNPPPSAMREEQADCSNTAS